MKKVFILLATATFLILIACSKNTDLSDNQSISSASLISETTNSKRSFQDVYPESDAIRLQGGIYVNERLGFQITFPDNWKNYYFIEEKVDDESGLTYIQINFYGKSKHGKYATSHYLDDKIIYTNGIPMFWIMQTDSVNSTLMGYVGQKAFYLAMPTDYSLPGYIDPSSPHYQQMIEAYPDEPEEVVNDGIKATEMSQDIEKIKNSFVPLK